MSEFNAAFALFGQGQLGRLIFASASQVVPLSFLMSGGASNALPQNSLGGTISTQPVPINLFFDIEPSRTQRIVDYRCIYIKNLSTVNFSSFEIFIQDQVSGGSNATIGIGGEVNETAFLCQNEFCTPPRVHFGISTILVGELNSNDYISLWIQRSTAANAIPIAGDGLTIGVRGIY